MHALVLVLAICQVSAQTLAPVGFSGASTDIGDRQATVPFTDGNTYSGSTPTGYQISVTQTHPTTQQLELQLIPYPLPTGYEYSFHLGMHKHARTC